MSHSHPQALCRSRRRPAVTLRRLQDRRRARWRPKRPQPLWQARTGWPGGTSESAAPWEVQFWDCRSEPLPGEPGVLDQDAEQGIREHLTPGQQDLTQRKRADLWSHLDYAGSSAKAPPDPAGPQSRTTRPGKCPNFDEGAFNDGLHHRMEPHAIRPARYGIRGESHRQGRDKRPGRRRCGCRRRGRNPARAFQCGIFGAGFYGVPGAAGFARAALQTGNAEWKMPAPPDRPPCIRAYGRSARGPPVSCWSWASSR